MAKLKKHNRFKYLDEKDMVLLINVSQGVDSCTYLSQILRLSKPQISRMVQELEEYDLVKVCAGTEQYFTASYQITNLGRKIVSSCLIDLNRAYLDTLKPVA
jgi:DNA-binding HxlR family transcriptional regulator